jgi:hypothetical protein
VYFFCVLSPLSLHPSCQALSSAGHVNVPHIHITLHQSGSSSNPSEAFHNILCFVWLLQVTMGMVVGFGCLVLALHAHIVSRFPAGAREANAADRALDKAVEAGRKRAADDARGATGAGSATGVGSVAKTGSAAGAGSATTGGVPPPPATVGYLVFG